jgi:hypothetical protein
VCPPSACFNFVECRIRKRRFALSRVLQRIPMGMICNGDRDAFETSIFSRDLIGAMRGVSAK